MSTSFSARLRHVKKNRLMRPGSPAYLACKKRVGAISHLEREREREREREHDGVAILGREMRCMNKCDRVMSIRNASQWDWTLVLLLQPKSFLESSFEVLATMPSIDESLKFISLFSDHLLGLGICVAAEAIIG